MTSAEEVWIPLVDEPIGALVEQAQADDPLIAGFVSSPRTVLAFRTFAYIRVGILLGEMLVESDVPEYDGTETWVDALLRNPQHLAAVRAEVRAVAEEVARDHEATTLPRVRTAAARLTLDLVIAPAGAFGTTWPDEGDEPCRGFLPPGSP
jgi:hypothetical protein